MLLAMAAHAEVGADVEDHVAPESLEVQIPPPLTTAACLVPSELDVIAAQLSVVPDGDISVQVAPLLDERQMLPPSTTAASTVPSADEATEVQDLDPRFWSPVHAMAPSAISTGARTTICASLSVRLDVTCAADVTLARRYVRRGFSPASPLRGREFASAT